MPYKNMDKYIRKMTDKINLARVDRGNKVVLRTSKIEGGHTNEQYYQKYRRCPVKGRNHSI